jgi:hypothetical protein
MADKQVSVLRQAVERRASASERDDKPTSERPRKQSSDKE